MQVQIDPVDYEIVAHRKTVKQDLSKIHKTSPRPQTSKLDILITHVTGILFAECKFIMQELHA